MKDVPVDYLWEFYCETKPWNEMQVQVMEYIEEHLEELKKEHTGLVWKKA